MRGWPGLCPGLCLGSLQHSPKTLARLRALLLKERKDRGGKVKGGAGEKRGRGGVGGGGEKRRGKVVPPVL